MNDPAHKKWMKAERNTVLRTHFEAHFSRGRRTHGLSQSTEFIIPKAPCLHPSQIGTSNVKKLKERALNFPGKLPAPSILVNLLLRFGSGSPLPLINAWYDADLWAFPGRVYRQKYRSLTRSGLTNRRRRTWRRSAATASYVRIVSYSSSSKFLSHLHCAVAQGLCCIKYQCHSCQEFYFSNLSC